MGKFMKDRLTTCLDSNLLEISSCLRCSIGWTDAGLRWFWRRTLSTSCHCRRRTWRSSGPPGTFRKSEQRKLGSALIASEENTAECDLYQSIVFVVDNWCKSSIERCRIHVPELLRDQCCWLNLGVIQRLRNLLTNLHIWGSTDQFTIISYYIQE